MIRPDLVLAMVFTILWLMFAMYGFYIDKGRFLPMWFYWSILIETFVMLVFIFDSMGWV